MQFVPNMPVSRRACGFFWQYYDVTRPTKYLAGSVPGDLSRGLFPTASKQNDNIRHARKWKPDTHELANDG